MKTIFQILSNTLLETISPPCYTTQPKFNKTRDVKRITYGEGVGEGWSWGGGTSEGMSGRHADTKL